MKHICDKCGHEDVIEYSINDENILSLKEELSKAFEIIRKLEDAFAINEVELLKLKFPITTSQKYTCEHSGISFDTKKKETGG